MNNNIFVNLPVKDLEKTKEFYSKLGYTFNPQFTNENAAAMVISDHIYAMLLTETFFKTFLKGKEIADSSKVTEVLTALSVDSKEQVDELVDKALAAGATTQRDPSDLGFMYSRSFYDLDGHTWEIVWMDPSNIQK